MEHGGKWEGGYGKMMEHGVNQMFLYGKMMEHGGKSEVLKWENDGTWL